MTIGQRLMQARKAQGLTQQQVATACNVARQTVSSWEAGRTYPDIESIIRLADLLQLSLDELLRPEGELLQVLKQRESHVADARRGLLANVAMLLLVTAIYAGELLALPGFQLGWWTKLLMLGIILGQATTAELLRKQYVEAKLATMAAVRQQMAWLGFGVCFVVCGLVGLRFGWDWHLWTATPILLGISGASLAHELRRRE
ncbi:helix-turn-helix domain-containing protein [Lacticaseibacillus daqingensis]|uniref:helix-turn-helix domain-containing protein n=1 Tax=Lacticaseibacillus daqingensis TaxID=2486014 RepID=UPI0013DDAF7A|nr:helix-turn-helix transcriptional regulator [Lacticaseibacillus daqingensis]